MSENLKRELEMNIGYITQVIGPVIDAVFSAGQLPKIYNALQHLKVKVKWFLV